MTWVVDRRTNSRTAGGGSAPTVPVAMDRPTPTLTGKAGNQWVFRNGAQEKATERTMDQPAPTILASADNGDSRFIHDTGTTYRLNVRAALVLQSFPEDYPVQGNKSKQFEQVGNAVPPLLAAHVIAAVMGIDPSAIGAAEHTENSRHIGGSNPPSLPLRGEPRG